MTFRKQFNDVIEKQLLKDIKQPQNITDELRQKFKKLKLTEVENHHRKLTLIIGLDGFLMKTSVFPKELPSVDASFPFNNITVYVCFRPHMREFIEECASIFELILWSTSLPEYTEPLFATLPKDL